MGGVISEQGGVSNGDWKRCELEVRRVTSVVKKGVFSMQDQRGIIQSEGGLDKALVESLTNLIAFILKVDHKRNGKCINKSMMPSKPWFTDTAQRINSYI